MAGRNMASVSNYEEDESMVGMNTKALTRLQRR
jgi:hypothetical protein